MRHRSMSARRGALALLAAATVVLTLLVQHADADAGSFGALSLPAGAAAATVNVYTAGGGTQVCVALGGAAATCVASGAAVPPGAPSCAALAPPPSRSPPPPVPPPPPSPSPPPGVAANATACALANATLVAATSLAQGACAVCTSSTGSSLGCTQACPACAAALSAYTTACAGDTTRLSVASLFAFAANVGRINDCYDLLSEAARPYAAASCSDAFRFVAAFDQTAGGPGVTFFPNVTMLVPYSCLSANAATCPAPCQADLDLLAAACHSFDVVSWAGLGLPGLSFGAPTGTAVSAGVAFALFANGTAAVPANADMGLWGAFTPLPLNLAACANNSAAAFSSASGRRLLQAQSTCLSVTVMQTNSTGAPALAPVYPAALDNATFLLGAGTYAVSAVLVYANGSPAGAPTLLPFTIAPPALSPSLQSAIAAGQTATNATALSGALALMAAAIDLNVTDAVAGTAISPAAVSPSLAALANITRAAAGVSGGALSALDAERAAGIAASFLQSGAAAGTLVAADLTNSLATLSVVAGSGASVTPAVAQTSVSGLSTVVNAAPAASPAGVAAVCNSAGAVVATLADTLSSGVGDTCFGALNVTNASSPSVLLRSPGIVMSISCDAGLNTSDSLFATGLTLPGTAAAAQVPSDTFSSVSNESAAVVSVFYALSFDPHGGNGLSASLVRLEFKDAATGTLIPLANLSQPLMLDVPVAGGAAAQQPTTRAAALRSAAADAAAGTGPAPVAGLYWNVALGAYTSDGMVSMPNPAPPNASMTWRDGFVSASPDDLPLAWSLSYPGCSEILVNCTDEWERTLAVSFDPQSSLGDPVVSCGDRRGFMRVFVGHACPLWPGGAAAAGGSGCLWNVTAQQFTGAGCVLSSVARVASTHTTDFSVGPAPQILVASPSDLASLTTGALAHQLRLLVAVIVGLFVGMHVLAYALSFRDAADGRRVLSHARSRALGASYAHDLYLWRFSQQPMAAPVDHAAGPAVEFAALIGTPYARLALAIPAHLFGGMAPKHATGRVHGMSGTALKRNHHVLIIAATNGLTDEHLVAPPQEAAPPAALAPAPAPARTRHEGLVTRSGAPRRCGVCREPIMRREDTVKIRSCGHRVHIGCAPDGASVCPICSVRGAQSPSVPSRASSGASSSSSLAQELQAYRQLQERTQPLHLKHLAQQRRLRKRSLSAVDENKEQQQRGSLLSRVFSKLRADAPPDVDDPAADTVSVTTSALSFSSSQFRDEHAAGGLLPLHAFPDLLQISSTALMHAFMQSWCMLSCSEVVQQQDIYVRLLDSMGVDPGGRTLLKLYAIYKELLMGHIFSGNNWAIKARVFRAVLLYDDAGFWEPDDELACVLQANAHEAREPPRRGVQALRDFFQNVVSTLILGNAEGSADAGVVEDIYDERRRDAATKLGRIETFLGHGPSTDHSSDDPLLFSGAAISESVPSTLLRQARGDAALAARMWATACTLVFLSTQNFSWLTAPHDDKPRSVVDDSRAWLLVRLREYCTHGTGTGDGEDDVDPEALLHALLEQASQKVTLWATNHDRLVTHSRAAHVTTPLYIVSEAQRLVSSVINSLLSRCTSIAMVLSVYSTGVRRWHTAILLISALITQLMVQIWLFWSKAQVCCGDARVALGCERSDAASCRGFAGMCADLQAIHYPFAISALDGVPRVLQPPPCQAFPDGGSRDSFLAGLISAGCALPVAALVASLWSLSMATDEYQIHRHVRLLSWPLAMRLTTGRFDWRFEVARGARLRKRLSLFWVRSWYNAFFVEVADAVEFVWRRIFPAAKNAPSAPAAAAPALDLAAANKFDALTTRFRYIGFCVLYATWGVFAWIILVYGQLIFRLMGPAVERDFVRAWGAGIGLSQLSDMQSFLVTTCQVLFLALILDALWLLPNTRWMETQLDYASIVATSFRRAAPGTPGAKARSWLRHGVRYVRHMKAVQA